MLLSMKRTTLLLLLVLLASAIKAQPSFVTIVPHVPVVIGEAFQVQYVLEDGTGATNFNAPAFQHFQIAAGPDVYPGSRIQSNNIKQSKNFVFTLVALTTGKLIIPGATIIINGRQIRSNNTFINVISKVAAAGRFGNDQSDNSDYFLRPGEDAQKKIRQNLFLKAMVNKNSCFVGEPIVATFKLYSRLESRSDIVKNPGFYGFTVHDMVNLSDKEVAIEKVNGKLFDVHIIRKVGLYPLQAGLFTIDAMEVNNTVKFSKIAVNKKTEQEIVEGVLIDNEGGDKKENTEEYESTMNTVPITINVKPLPEKNKPSSFDGAAGLFTISANAVKNKLSTNEGDVLEITLSGKGNFKQVNAPAVKWPKGIEGFDPLIKDSLDKLSSPLTGSRIYRYPFAAASPETYIIPAIIFSFFNTDSGNYKTITTTPLQVRIDRKMIDSISGLNEKTIHTRAGENNYWLISGGMALLFSSIFWFLKKRKINAGQSIIKSTPKNSLSVNEILAPASLLLQADDQIFYTSLQHSICNYFSFHFDLMGSKMNKENIATKLKESKVDEVLIDDVKNILQQCEAGIFTNARLKADKERLLVKTKDVLELINKSLF